MCRSFEYQLCFVITIAFQSAQGLLPLPLPLPVFLLPELLVEDRVPKGHVQRIFFTIWV